MTLIIFNMTSNYFLLFLWCFVSSRLVGFTDGFSMRCPISPPSRTMARKRHIRRNLTSFRSRQWMSLDASADPMVEQMGRENLQKYFNFPIDSWQAQAGGEILSGHNVIVCAPTGAGKTVVGEMALHHAFHSHLDGAAIYTTPLKALSNQKYAELRKIFGAKHVGLSTGDMSINRGARIMVMTTEVYRNMAWRAMDGDGDEDNDGGDGGLLNDDLSRRGRNELSNVKVVVLDEFHYMGQKGRGGVWEECVITSPSHTQIIGLSATLPNADKLAMWMEKVTERKSTLVEAIGGRPVPLRYLFATRDGLDPIFRNKDAGPGSPLGLLGLRGDGVPEKSYKHKKNDDKQFDIEERPKGLDMNPKLKSMIQQRVERVNRAIARKVARIENENLRRRVSNEYSDTRSGGGRALSPKEERQEKEKMLKSEMRKSVPSLHYLLRKLNDKDLLPAIFFVFSRAGCDEAAENVCFQMRKGAELVNAASTKGFREVEDKYEGKRRKSRQRSARKTDAVVLKDKNGRSFRTNSNYVSEDTMSSILDRADIVVDFDTSNPLEENKFKEYSERGLLTYTQVKEVAARIKVFNQDNEEIKFTDGMIDRFLHGVGSHHAGQLPAHKAFIESLFRAQLMKVVFATETLAAGINMPARTTVICSLAKRGDGGSMNTLDTANTLQMAGRAGRRGMDTDGTCVLVTTPFEGPEEAIEILLSEIAPVESQFSPGYSLAVNLIARGKGKLDVARKLVQKSFAQWTRQEVETKVESVKELHGEDFEEMVEIAAHERILELLLSYIDKGRNKELYEVLDDKSLLKKASKSFTGLYQILTLEESTLSYLLKELEMMSSIDSAIDSDGMAELLTEDNINIQEEIKRQRQRIRKANDDVSNHIMTALANKANALLRTTSPTAEEMKAALAVSRKNSEDLDANDELSPLELTKFAKSAVTMNRKRRKQKSVEKSSGIDSSSLIDALNAVDDKDDSLDDLKSLIYVLQAYGCIVPTLDGDSVDMDEQSYRITTAGENVGLIGLDNALWVLTAMGGAWDVVGASADLDKFKTEMRSLGAFGDDEDYYGNFENDEQVKNESTTNKGGIVGSNINDVPLPQSEAFALTTQLRKLQASEIAGYVSCLVADGGRRDGNTSVLAAFQQLTPAQQRVVQSSLLALERLTEVQNKYSIDENTRKVQLELGTCEVVTAWTEGCSWNEALEISGAAPGDLVRILHRALDALRQLGNLPVNAVRSMDASAGVIQQESPGIHPDIRRLCRAAATAMDRYPVKDPLPFDDDDDNNDSEQQSSQGDDESELS